MEDAKIIALFWERNEQAVKETDAAYGGKLYGLSNRILNNREDAEESVSDTYMETWKSIPPPANLFLCLFGIHLPQPVSKQAGLAHGGKEKRRGGGVDAGDGKLYP